jgi:hypothetical protein
MNCLDGEECLPGILRGRLLSSLARKSALGFGIVYPSYRELEGKNIR